MDIIAEVALDLRDDPQQVLVRIYKPQQNADPGTWSCCFSISEPLGTQREIFGESSLQALALALKTLSAHLYGSELYANGKLGIDGQFGGSLSLPAPHLFHDIAPYPF